MHFYQFYLFYSSILFHQELYGNSFQNCVGYIMGFIKIVKRQYMSNRDFI